MQIEGTRVREQRPLVGVVRLDIAPKLVERPAQRVGHLRDVAIENRAAVGKPEQFVSDVVEADSAPIALRIQQFRQRVGRGERRDVLLVDQQRAGPDRRHRQARSPVSREGPVEHIAVAREFGQCRRERHRRVVGRHVIPPQAVDQEQKDIRTRAGRMEAAHKIDRNRRHRRFDR